MPTAAAADAVDAAGAIRSAIRRKCFLFVIAHCRPVRTSVRTHNYRVNLFDRQVDGRTSWLRQTSCRPIDDDYGR